MMDPYSFERISFVPARANKFASTTTSTTSASTTSSTTRISCGLVNLGVTCFLNATLQCLINLPRLAALCLAHTHSSTCSKQSHACAWCLLEAQICAALTATSPAIRPSIVLSNIKLFARRLSIHQQQDAHEFLRLVVDSLHRSEQTRTTPSSSSSSSPSSLVESLWGGKLRSRVQCSRCKGTSDVFEPLLDVSLELRGTLSAALEHFCMQEKLSGANAYRCERCQSLQTATKALTIEVPPQSLIVHLKRFEFLRGRGRVKKNDPVVYGERLDLAPFLSSTAGGTLYELSGVVVHQGSAHAGHYFAFVRGPSNWFQMDDVVVQKCQPGLHLRQQAYILFYNKATAAPAAKPKPAPAPQPLPAPLPAPQPLPQSLPQSLPQVSVYQCGRTIFQAVPSNYNILMRVEPASPPPSILRVPFQPPTNSNSHSNSNNNTKAAKRTREEAEYDAGHQKKVRRKEDWSKLSNKYQQHKKKHSKHKHNKHNKQKRQLK
jgi:ubiquitin C-terminal hydrolase